MFDFFKKKEDPYVLCSIEFNPEEMTKAKVIIDYETEDYEDIKNVFKCLEDFIIPEDWEANWLGIFYGKGHTPGWLLDTINDKEYYKNSYTIKDVWDSINYENKIIDKLIQQVKTNKVDKVKPYKVSKKIISDYLIIDNPEDVLNIIDPRGSVLFKDNINKNSFKNWSPDHDKMVAEFYKMFNTVKKKRLEFLKVIEPYLSEPENLKKEEFNMSDIKLEEEQIDVQTNEPAQEPSKVVVLDVPDYLEKVKTHLPLLVDSIKWLQQYKQDPYKAVGTFTEEGHPLASQFSDIKDGLVGAFSSEKAIILGAKKLLTYIEGTADSVKHDYTELSNKLASWVAKDLSANLNSIIETTDPGMLEKRKLMYRQNAVTLKYGNYKLEKCIQPYIQEISSSMNMVEYLKRIKELQHSLKLDLKPLEETIRKFKYNNVYIANNNAYIGKSQFMQNRIDKNSEYPESVNHLQAYQTFLNNADISQDHDTVAIDILDNIIDNFGGTLQGLKRSVEDFLKLLNSIGENNSKFNDSINILIEQYVVPYGENSCLKDDYIMGYNQCMLAISNSLNNDENLITHISHVGNQLECLLNNYSYLYSFLEKLTVEMTVTEKSSVSE